MILAAGTVLALAAKCAPTTAPETLLAVARAESGLDPLAIGVNRGGSRPRPARSPAEAVSQARALMAGGANIDLGLAQINSANLAALNLSIEDAFEPCRSLAAAATVLIAGYRAGLGAQTDPQRALRIAFSLYNTGDRRRGFANGYVARVERAAAQRAPLDVPPSPSAAAPPWDAFGDLRPAAFILAPASRSGVLP